MGTIGIWDSTPIQEAELIDNHTQQVTENADTNSVNEVVKTELVKEGFKGLPVRGSGDRIYLLKGGKKHWISNAETYSKLGFKFGDEREIDAETLAVLQEGEPIRSE